MRQERANPDVLAASTASGQYGVITLAQLRANGLNPEAISRRVRAGRLHRVHRGVYAVGHLAIGSKGRWLAAVLVCGEGAVLSHLSAAGLWELLPPVIAPVHVTIATDSGRRTRPGTRLHRGRFIVDFLWREQRVIVETDGARYHRGTVAREEDAARDARLEQLGFEVARFSYARVTRDPAGVAATVRALLGG